MIYNFNPPVGQPVISVYYDTELSQLSVIFRDGSAAYHYPVPFDAYQAFLLAELGGTHYRHQVQCKYPRYDSALPPPE